MRLIDANAVEKNINESIAQMTELGIRVNEDYLWALINEFVFNAPTVDAIPVKWLKQKIAQMRQPCEAYEVQIIEALIKWWEAERDDLGRSS